MANDLVIKNPLEIEARRQNTLKCKDVKQEMDGI